MSEGDDEQREPAPFRVYTMETESSEAALARNALNPSTHAAFALGKWADRLGQQDVNEVRAELERQAKAASANDLSRLEGMLTMQAHTLDALFSNLAMRARNTMEYPQAWERFMRMALKAQSQCRTTIETLAEIKNPKPVAFVQQANIANGPQQVNNGAPLRTRAAMNGIEPNKLLEHTHVGRLEAGTTTATIVGNPLLEAAAAVNRPKDDRE